jgi:uncharacterized membrane protein
MSPTAGIGGRTQQAGTLVAASAMPITFQRTLMPRSTMDQALTTGISTALNYGFAALIQDTVEAVALRFSGARSPEEVDHQVWRRATIVVDAVAMGLGFAAQTALRQRPGDRLPRGAARTAAWWLSATGIAGTIVGVTQHVIGQRRGSEDRSFPVAVPAGVVLAAANEYRRRRWEAADEGALCQRGRVRLCGQGVRHGARRDRGADGRCRRRTSLRHRRQPGARRDHPRVEHERLFRPVGHMAALSVIAGGIYALLRRVDHRIERGAEGIEEGFDVAPTSSFVSGGPDSLVPWETLSRQGRRNVSTVLAREMIEQVMGEPAVADPIRVFVGLESAPTERERVELAMKELERTRAFERELLLVISPTGTGYVNYVAVEAAEYMTRGNIASVTMQYSLRPSPLSLDRVDEGRRHYRMLVDAIHNRLAQLPRDRRPRVALFGESLGAWTSQDAFEHRGTQGLLDAGIDHAIWIGSPYMSKWKEQVLKSDRPDVDRSLLGRFNDFGQLEALDADARRRLRYVMITHDNDAVAHFGLDLLAQAPEWLGPAETRAASVPKSQAVAEPDGVRPNAGRHEERGERDPRAVRGEGPRLPGGPRALRKGGLPLVGER